MSHVAGISFGGYYLLTFLFPEINHNQLVVKAPLKQCETLACTLEQLASGHLTKLKNHESDSTEDRIDHYRVTLSDQMHHICDKYHLFVLEQRPFKKDAEAVKCLDQRVFSLLVVQPPVFYAKRFLRIGSCYKQMSAYFDHIGCGLAITSSYEAQKAYKEALEIAEELVPKNLVQCFEISISIAETMEFGRRRDKAYTYLENVQPANNHNLDDLAKTISEARAKVGEWKRANRVSPRRVPLVIDSGAP